MNPRAEETFNNLNGIAWQALQARNYYLAIKTFQESIVLNPAKSNSYYGLGCAYMINKEINKALSTCLQGIKLDPPIAEMWCLLGDIYFNKQQYSESAFAYERATEIDPSDDSWFGIARALSHNGNNKEAIEACQKCLEINPNSLNGNYAMALTYYNEGVYEMALNKLKKIIKTGVQDETIWNMLGETYLKLKDFVNAEMSFNKSIEINPLSIRAWGGLGNSCEKIHNYRRAIVAYGNAIKIDPQNSKTYYNIALCYEKNKQYPEAIHFNKICIELDKADHGAWSSLGLIYSKLNDSNKALNAFETSIYINPSEPLAWCGKGIVFFYLKKYDDALSALKQSLKLDRNFPDSWMYLGKTFMEIGQGQKGFISISRFISLASTSEIDEYFQWLIKFFKENEESLLAYRTLGKHFNWDTFYFYGSFFKNLHTAFAEIENYLTHLKLSGYSNKEAFSFDLIDALLAYYLIDPIRAFNLFDEKLDIENEEYNMLVQYYLLRCSYDNDIIFNEFSSVKKDVLSKALQIAKNRGEFSQEQVYYAGMSLFFLDCMELALKCFSYISDFLPARVMIISCLSELDKGITSQIEELLSLHQQTGFLKDLYYQGFDTSRDPVSQVKHFAHFREIAEHLQYIQHYVRENKERHREVDWESLSEVRIRPFVDSTGKEKLALEYGDIIKKECQILNEELKEDVSFFRKYFSLLIHENHGVEMVIGDLIRDSSRSDLFLELDNFKKTLVYFHFVNKIDYEQKICLTYWLYGNYHVHLREKRKVPQTIKTTLNLCIGYLFTPYIATVTPTPELVGPLLAELVSHAIGKVMEEILENKESFPATYSDFKRKVKETENLS
ncbi:MAG: tetratricopeptide repeat protein [Owenweeksia sp.]